MRHASAIVLAAGRGERMRPLTDHTPKPLLAVRGRPLIAWHLDALAAAGHRDVVINTAWLEEQFTPTLGARYGVLGITYSREGHDFGGALETAGGIARALPLLDDPFWVAAGDVFMPGFAFDRAAVEPFAASGALAHLWLVRNPAHNPRGDFALRPDGRLDNGEAGPRYTYSTVGLYRKALFDTLPAGNPQGLKAALAPLLRRAIDNGRVTGELWTGDWTDVGTPERLALLNPP